MNIIISNTTTIANPNHSGESTHNHDQAITPVSLSVMNINARMLQKLRRKLSCIILTFALYSDITFDNTGDSLE